MALLTRYERQILTNATPAYALTDCAARLANASTWQCQGRPGTGHVRLVANPLAGDQIHVAAQPVTADERGYAGSGVVYRFTSSGTAPAGEVPVVIGAGRRRVCRSAHESPARPAEPRGAGVGQQ